MQLKNECILGYDHIADMYVNNNEQIMCMHIHERHAIFSNN